ncbi:hypothetical protein LUCX_33 [Xanthomonas phage vB_XciM_LucasX]|nr:hypothetical protein LUCX_33 [Xanthomonas phage vB_XciM_LucasX]
MNLKSLLKNLSRVTSRIGETQSIIRMVATAMQKDHRKVNISYRPLTLTKTSVLPWVADKVVTLWSIEAEILQKDGQVFVYSTLSKLDLEQAIELVMHGCLLKASVAAMRQMRQTQQVAVG